MLWEFQTPRIAISPKPHTLPYKIVIKFSDFGAFRALGVFQWHPFRIPNKSNSCHRLLIKHPKGILNRASSSLISSISSNGYFNKHERERSVWIYGTTWAMIPVGLCLRRTAVSLLLRCWPPGPDALNVFISHWSISSSSDNERKSLLLLLLLLLVEKALIRNWSWNWWGVGEVILLFAGEVNNLE